MGKPWSDQTAKGAPLVALDQFMILDSEDAVPATKNKLVLLSTVQANLVTSVDGNDLTLVN